jgi:hypothetical protein
LFYTCAGVILNKKLPQCAHTTPSATHGTIKKGNLNQKTPIFKINRRKIFYVATSFFVFVSNSQSM